MDKKAIAIHFLFYIRGETLISFPKHAYELMYTHTTYIYSWQKARLAMYTGKVPSHNSPGGVGHGLARVRAYWVIT